MEEILNQEQQEEVDEEFGDEYGEDENSNLTNPKLADQEEVDYEDNLGSNKAALNFDMFTKNLLLTNHLPGFNIFDQDLGLIGKDYEAAKKALYYYQNSLRQDTVSYKINYKTKIDNRMHLLIITNPGSGKSTIKNQNKRIMKDFNGEEGVIEASGVSHPEQLIGKIKYSGKAPNKTATPIKGYLGYKCFMNDESQDMLNEKNDIFAKSQRLKRLAMDSYGLNEISKKLVDDSADDALKYYSPTRICDFAHPVVLESPFFDTGSFRRYFSFNVSQDDEMNLGEISEFDFNKPYQSKISWKDFLDNNYKTDVDVVFNKETLDIISHFHRNILDYLLTHKNKNALRYVVLTKYSLQDLFCSNVLILSKIKKETTPSFKTTINACSDTLLFIFKSIETYNNLGNMATTSGVWGGADEEDIEALEYLLKKGDTNYKNSNTSITKFQSILAHFHGCRLTQSRAHHYKLKRKGFVNSKQTGKYDSKVWLNFVPKGIKIVKDGYDPLEFWNKHFKPGIVSKKEFFDTLKQIFPCKGAEGIGVTPPPLAYI